MNNNIAEPRQALVTILVRGDAASHAMLSGALDELERLRERVARMTVGNDVWDIRADLEMATELVWGPILKEARLAKLPRQGEGAREMAQAVAEHNARIDAAHADGLYEELKQVKAERDSLQRRLDACGAAMINARDIVFDASHFSRSATTRYRAEQVLRQLSEALAAARAPSGGGGDNG